MSQLGLGMTTGAPEAGKRRPNRRGGVAVLVAMVVVLALVVVGLVSVVHWATDKPDYSGSGHGQVTVEVRAGDSVSQVGEALARAGVVRSSSAFVDVAGSDPSGADIR